MAGRDPEQYEILQKFTCDGTPLPAIIGNKMEWGVVTLTALSVTKWSGVLLLSLQECLLIKT
jgi:hypothetical protein